MSYDSEMYTTAPGTIRGATEVAEKVIEAFVRAGHPVGDGVRWEEHADYREPGFSVMLPMGDGVKSAMGQGLPAVIRVTRMAMRGTGDDDSFDALAPADQDSIRGMDWAIRLETDHGWQGGAGAVHVAAILALIEDGWDVAWRELTTGTVGRGREGLEVFIDGHHQAVESFDDALRLLAGNPNWGRG